MCLDWLHTLHLLPAYMYIYVCVCMHIHIDIYIYMHIYIYVYAEVSRNLSIEKSAYAAKKPFTQVLLEIC